MVTSRDVARVAGVSQTTVSRVLSGSVAVAPETRAKVTAALERTGYVPNASARAMKTGHSGVVGVLVADLTNPFYPELLEVLETALARAGLRMTIWIADGEKNSAALSAVNSRNIDGVVFAAISEVSDELMDTIGEGRPVVLVNRTVDGLACDQVASDGFAGGRLVAECFAAAGRLRTAFVGGGADTSTTQKRLAGFRAGMEVAGAPPATVVYGTYAYESGVAAAHELLTGDVVPQAVMCANDLIAFGFIDEARALGHRVPEDLWVAGHDDVDISAWRGYAMSSVRTDMDALASEAVALILRRLKDPKAHAKHVFLQPTFVQRSSTGKPSVPPA